MHTPQFQVVPTDKNGGYDVVIEATGAKAKLPNSVSGLVDEKWEPLYPACHDVFGMEQTLGHSVILVGALETGMETAM